MTEQLTLHLLAAQPPSGSLLPRCPHKVWERVGESLSVMSQLTVESRIDRAENALFLFLLSLVTINPLSLNFYQQILQSDLHLSIYFGRTRTDFISLSHSRRLVR